MTKLKESFAASESLTESSIISAASYDKSIAKGGVACPFPWRLHEMLEAAEREGEASRADALEGILRDR